MIQPVEVIFQEHLKMFSHFCTLNKIMMAKCRKLKTRHLEAFGMNADYA